MRQTVAVQKIRTFSVFCGTVPVGHSRMRICSKFCDSLNGPLAMVQRRTWNDFCKWSRSVLREWWFISVTRLGDFWKFLVTKSLTKVAQMYGNYWGYFEKHHFLGKNSCCYYLAASGIFLSTFYPNIWSHCGLPKDFTALIFRQHYFSSILIEC